MYYRVTGGKIQLFDNNGNPAYLYEVYTYVAGTVDTPVATYSNRDLAVGHLNTNPVVLNARGEADIYVGVAVKLVFVAPGGDPTSPIWSVDYIGEQQANFVSGNGVTPSTNNYVVTTSPAVSALVGSFMLIMTPDEDNVDTIGVNTFTPYDALAPGANDCTAGGPYLGAAAAIITVTIDGMTPGPPTAVENVAAGTVTVGNHYVKISHVTAAGETIPGAASAVVAAAGVRMIDVSDITISPSASVTARNVYMTEAGGTDYYYVDQIPDNVTEIYTIDIDDVTLALNALAPTVDTSELVDTFTWKKDGGAWHPGIEITGLAQSLIEGFTVTFATITGHVWGDSWAIATVTPARINLDTLGNLLVYKNQGGSVVALDGQDMLVGYPAQLILNAALNAWLLINPATPTFDVPTISAVRYRKNLTAGYVLLAADEGYELSCVGTFTVDLLTPPEFASRFFYIKNADVGVITVDAGAGYTINWTGTPSQTITLAPGTAVQLITNGVNWHVVTDVSFKSGYLLYDVAGTYAWSAVSDRAYAKVCGGGGGSTQNYNGGGGGYLEGWIDLAPGTSYNIVVGAGGAKSQFGAADEGGASSVGALITVPGGKGATQLANGAAGNVCSNPGTGGPGSGTGGTSPCTFPLTGVNTCGKGGGWDVTGEPGHTGLVLISW